MKSLPWFFLCIALSLVSIACQPTVSPITDDTTQVTFSGTLVSLPELKLKLPKSLSLESSEAARTRSRAWNDVTDLTAANVGSVKSQNWMSLQQGNGLLPVLNRAFDLIGDYAKENDIKEGVSFSIPISRAQVATFIGTPESYIPSDMDVKNNFLVKGNDPRDYTLYVVISARFSCPTGDTTTTYQFNVRSKLGIVTPEGGSAKIKMWMDVDAGDAMSQRMYADIDAGTGACTMVNGNVSNGTVDSSKICVMLSEVGLDGSISNLNTSSNGSTRSYYVAYGNDAAGGIASSYSFPMVVGNTSVMSSYYWGEYYDGKGDIIVRSNGSDQITWAPPTNNSCNIKSIAGLSDIADAPETIFVKTDWSGTDPSFSVSADGINWFPRGQIQDCWSYYFMKGTSWATGDAYYYWKSWEFIDNCQIATLYAGYKVPETTTFNGKQYYVTKEYPLRNLLPVTDQGLCLKQKEGESPEWTWTDQNGTVHTNTYTFYTYWLENLYPKNADGTLKTGNPTECLASDGDIDLNDKLSQYDMYFYDGTAMSKVKSYFFRTTASLPPYFSNPDPNGLCASVEGKLQEVLNRGVAMDFTKYAPLLESLMNDPTILEMAP